jgi:hypothetical protein
MTFKWADGFVRSIFAGWKWCLSFRKRDWRLNDYPILVRARAFDSMFASPRFKQGRYDAYIVHWGLAGIGDTRPEALADLSDKFETAKAEKAKLGELLPRPGSRMPITFASNELISSYADLSDDFTRRVLELDWAWISDESTLWDFHGEQSNDALCDKIKEIYGVDVSDIGSAKLSEILDRIARKQTSEPIAADRK